MFFLNWIDVNDERKSLVVLYDIMMWRRVVVVLFSEYCEDL